MENKKTQATAGKTASFNKRGTAQDGLQAAMHRLKEYLQVLEEWQHRLKSKERSDPGELVEDLDEGRVSS